MNYPNDITDLLELSVRLGRNPLQVQASSGNTSIKLDGVLWIKASGKWLEKAREEDILVPLNLTEVRRELQHGQHSFCTATGSGTLRPSIETAMHAVVPHRVVIHTHSVSAIAWAVRTDDAERLAERLGGLRWQWIPYMPSGLPLARAIEQALTSSPATDVFVLANHGLVVCEEDCPSAERLLSLVETRLAVAPRCSAMGDPIDATSLRILAAGTLYPCQAIFLGECLDQQDLRFSSVGDRVTMLGRNLSEAQLAVLNGLLEVARRIPEDAPVRYLSSTELAALKTPDSHAYKHDAELNGTRSNQRSLLV